MKNGRIIHPQDLKGLKEFQKDYPEVTPVFIYRGENKVKKNGIVCIPAKEFFQTMNPNCMLPI